MECSEFTHIRSDKVIYMRSKRDKVEKIDKTENEEQQVDMESIKKQKIQLSILTKLGWASFVAIFGFGGWLVIQYTTLNREIGELKTSYNDFNDRTASEFDNIAKSFDQTAQNIANINDAINGNNTIDGLTTRVSLIEQRLDMIPIAASTDISSDIQATIEANDISKATSAPIASSDTIIGNDAEGNVYLAEDVVNQTILLTYTEKSQEVYFVGQFDEEYHWDGNCIINVYNQDNSLSIITEACYDSGTLTDYKQVFPENNNWVYSERKKVNETNEGKTYVYSWDYKQIKNFTLTNVKSDDIYTAANFAEKIDGTLKNYYKGNTSDGRYNDNTGNAYLVCYDDQGYVLSLYIGQFKNGKYDDMSGKAIEVVFDSSNNINRYFFYKGKFKNGGRVNDENIEYVSIEQLQVLLKNIEFECSLDWME